MVGDHMGIRGAVGPSLLLPNSAGLSFDWPCLRYAFCFALTKSGEAIHCDYPLLRQEMPVIRAAVAQCGSVYNDNKATLARMRAYVNEATSGDQKASLIVFPEAFIGGALAILHLPRILTRVHAGYPKFQTFGVSVGTRSDTGRREFAKYYHNAISVPGPEITEVEAIAREHDIFIVTGFIERQGGTLYCVAGFFSPIDGLLYRRRKVRHY